MDEKIAVSLSGNKVTEAFIDDLRNRLGKELYTLTDISKSHDSQDMEKLMIISIKLINNYQDVQVRQSLADIITIIIDMLQEICHKSYDTSVEFRLDEKNYLVRIDEYLTDHEKQKMVNDMMRLIENRH